ncbi:MAG: acyl-CoA thioesterase [Cyclobacteriaceae bacterium]|nr:acyl-CoA thioesterase [Cyclobacteriaceae bacterium]
MFKAESELRVRYVETDQMGYSHHSNYIIYYEYARVEALRSLGMSYKQLEDSGVMMPVIDSGSKYLKPALYDDLIKIEVTVPSLPSVRMRFEYKLYINDVLINEGYTTLAFVNMETGRPMPAPASMMNLLKYFYE